jgi:hypothetical protein
MIQIIEKQVKILIDLLGFIAFYQASMYSPPTPSLRQPAERGGLKYCIYDHSPSLRQQREPVPLRREVKEGGEYV